ncbi:TonB-dependent Receptor Plug Domain protein [compost metagenome]
MRKVLQKGIVGACVISMTVAPSYAKLTQLTIAGIASQKKASVSETKKVTEMQTLNEVLTGLSKSLNVHFIFVDDDLANKLVIAPAFSGKKSDKASLEKTLDDLLASYSLTSKKISEKQYVISRLTEPVNTTEKEESIVVVPTITAVTPDVTVKNDVIDEKVVSGTVTDAVDGSPLPGASVSVKGSSIGTSTDVNGKYSLKVPSETAVLVISYLGYNAKEVTVGTNTTINVHLTPNSKGLQEVIVVAYGTQKKASVIGSVANLSSKAFENSPRVSAQESLQGNVAGVQASNGSGQPGSVPSIRIRGIGSINASSSPLYVIDGVPVVADDLTSYNTNTIAGLNSSDIESISVLKDATAASLYGSRAANGVILITTKSGKAGKTRFNASFQQGVNRLTNSDATKPLNTTEALELIREGWLNSGKTAADFDAEIIKQKINSSVNTDWRNELTRAGNYNQFDLSASGGSEKTTYFLSGGYYDAKAPLKGVDYKRTTARVTLNTQATERLSFNSNLSFSYQKSNTVSDAGAFANPVRAMYRLQPWLTVYNNDGSYNFSYNSGHNPVATINETYRRGTSSAFLGKIGGKYKFADFLMFESNASLDYNNAGIDRFQSPLFGDGKNVNGRSLTGTDVWQNWNTTNILRFNKVLDEKHNLSAFVGYEAQRITGKGSATEYTNLLPGKTSPATGSTPQNVTPLNTESTLTGLFLSANYGYNDRYLMSASVRRDGSSRFGANKRYGTFWSLGAAWKYS